MIVSYDYKMHGLLVEVGAETLREMAESLCKEGDRPDLVKMKANHITYLLEVPKETRRRTALLSLALAIVATGVTALLLLLGVYQVGLWIVQWLY